MKNQEFILKVFSGFILFFLICTTAVNAEKQKEEKPLTVTDGNKVTIEYTVKLKSGVIIDTTEGTGGAINYLQGYNELVPGLEKAIVGMKIGESKHVVVKPEDAYGEEIPEALIEVRKDQLPQKDFKVGSKLETKDDMGRTVYSIVKEIKKDTVILNFNHPLAGKTLYFDVKVVNIKDVGPVQK